MQAAFYVAHQSQFDAVGEAGRSAWVKLCDFVAWFLAAPPPPSPPGESPPSSFGFLRQDGGGSSSRAADGDAAAGSGWGLLLLRARGANRSSVLPAPLGPSVASQLLG